MDVACFVADSQASPLLSFSPHSVGYSVILVYLPLLFNPVTDVSAALSLIGQIDCPTSLLFSLPTRNWGDDWAFISKGNLLYINVCVGGGWGILYGNQLYQYRLHMC